MKSLIAVSVLALSGCGMFSPQLSDSQAMSGVGCITGATWNGSPASALVMNQEKIVGTAGGVASVKCGAAEITFTDSGNLNMPLSMRVPIQQTPMKLVPAQ